ncbi:WW domain-containing protein [Pseudoscourfieldia marina]
MSTPVHDDDDISIADVEAAAGDHPSRHPHQDHPHRRSASGASGASVLMSSSISSGGGDHHLGGEKNFRKRAVSAERQPAYLGYPAATMGSPTTTGGGDNNVAANKTGGGGGSSRGGGNSKLLLHRRRASQKVEVKKRKRRWYGRCAMTVISAIVLLTIYLQIGRGIRLRDSKGRTKTTTSAQQQPPSPPLLLTQRPDETEPAIIRDENVLVMNPSTHLCEDVMQQIIRRGSNSSILLHSDKLSAMSDSSFGRERRNQDHDLFFLHVPRTAGRTFHQCLLKAAFPPSQRCPRMYDGVRIARRRQSAYHEEEYQPPYENAEGCGLMASHDDFSIRSYVPDGSAWISQIRHPVDRVLSAYEFAHEVAVRKFFSKNKTANKSMGVALRRRRRWRQLQGTSWLSSSKDSSINTPKSKSSTKRPVRAPGVSTRNVWPWNILVPFVERHMERRVNADTAWNVHHKKDHSAEAALLEEDGVPLLVHSRDDESFDPYNNNVMLPFEAFVESRVVRDLIHEGMTLQLVGFTNNSLHKEAGFLRRCSRQPHPLDDNNRNPPSSAEAWLPNMQTAMLDIAKRRLEAMQHFGMTDRLNETVSLMFAEMGWTFHRPAWRVAGAVDNMTDEERRKARIENLALFDTRAPDSDAISDKPEQRPPTMENMAELLQLRVEAEKNADALTPPFWTMHPSRQHKGHYFYHHSITKESKWEPPAFLPRNEQSRQIYKEAMQLAETRLNEFAHKYLEAAKAATNQEEISSQVREDLARAQADINVIAFTGARAFGYNGDVPITGGGGTTFRHDGDIGEHPIFAPTTKPLPGVSLPDSRYLLPNSTLLETYLECERRTRSRYEQKRTSAFHNAKDAQGRGPVVFSKENRRIFISERLRKRIIELNPMDMKLYSFASRLFDTRVEEAKSRGIWNDLPTVVMTKQKKKK